MTPDEEVERLDRICELIQLGLDALDGHVDNVARLGRTALKIAKSEIAQLKDEAVLADMKMRTRVPKVARPCPRTRKK